MARKASPSTCPLRASPGAQASTRVPKATVYPGVSTHWTSSLEWLQIRRRLEPPRRGRERRREGIRVLVGLFGYMLCSSGEEGGCEWSVGCASPIHHESRPSPPSIHQHPDLPPVRELGKGERGVPRVRMGRKRERECSPWKKGENECAMSAPRNQDRMVPPSNATPSRGGPEGGGVPVQTESPDTSVSG